MAELSDEIFFCRFFFLSCLYQGPTSMATPNLGMNDHYLIIEYRIAIWSIYPLQNRIPRGRFNPVMSNAGDKQQQTI